MLDLIFTLYSHFYWMNQHVGGYLPVWLTPCLSDHPLLLACQHSLCVSCCLHLLLSCLFVLIIAEVMWAWQSLWILRMGGAPAPSFSSDHSQSPGTSVTFVKNLQVENDLNKILLLLAVFEPPLTKLSLHVHQLCSRCLQTQPCSIDTRGNSRFGDLCICGMCIFHTYIFLIPMWCVHLRILGMFLRSLEATQMNGSGKLGNTP